METPRLCLVDKDYIKYLHDQIDRRVSVKYNNRPFVVLTIDIAGREYAIPLTSQTTAERIKAGKKKRNSTATTFIYDGDIEIANLLHNNMFPVPASVLTDVKINPITDTYLSNEERFIRKHYQTIKQKTENLYKDRYDTSKKNYAFLNKICCDFQKLEQACDSWGK